MRARAQIDFLRRRYAIAILRDDAPTAGRLRDQLDGLMNRGAGASEPLVEVTPAQTGGQTDLCARLAWASVRVIDHPDAIADREI